MAVLWNLGVTFQLVCFYDGCTDICSFAWKHLFAFKIQTIYMNGVSNLTAIKGKSTQNSCQRESNGTNVRAPKHTNFNFTTRQTTCLLKESSRGATMDGINYGTMLFVLESSAAWTPPRPLSAESGRIINNFYFRYKTSFCKNLVCIFFMYPKYL